jgi:hypothetical protein
MRRGGGEKFIHEGILAPAERNGVHPGVQNKLVRILLTRMRGREDQGDGLTFRSFYEIGFSLSRVLGDHNGGVHGKNLKTTPRPFLDGDDGDVSPLEPRYH